MFAKRALTALRAGLPQLRRHRTTSAPAALVSSKRCRPLLSRACPLKVHPTAHFSSIARSETTSQAQDAGDLPYETERERLRWRRKPSKVLIVKKISSKFADSMAEEVAAYLHNHGVQAFMDEKDIYVGPNKQPIPYCTSFDFQSAAREGSPKPEFDFTICLGGDGTLLHYGSLYNTEAEYIPPVMTLGLGTLGFISSMDPSSWEHWIQHVLEADGVSQADHSTEVFCTQKDRLRCTIVKKDEHSKVWLASESGAEWLPDEVFYCMNEFVIDRGSEMSLNQLGLTIDGIEVTTVEADGLIVSTPSGSTGYNLSAGGSISAPTVPCVLVTPIAPHTLSFRPIVIHLDCVIEIDVLLAARIDARALFDCRNARRVQRGDRVVIAKSSKSIPILSFKRPDDEWFQSITSKLGWNSRAAKTNSGGFPDSP